MCHVVRFVRSWITVFCASALSAQNMDLAETVSAPLVHLAVQPTDAGEQPAWDWLGDLQRLGFEVSGEAGADDPSKEANHAIALLVRLLAGGDNGVAWEEMELAWTGTLPQPGGAQLPLLIFRVQLPEATAEQLRGLLEGGGLTRRGRSTAGHQVFVLADSPEIELALVDCDLVVSNHTGSMNDVLDPEAERARALASDPVYRSLRTELGATGALVLYADLARVRNHLPDLLTDETGALRGSGIAAMRRLMLAARPEDNTIRTSVLLEGKVDPEGWVAQVERMRVQDLVARVPAAGLGGLVLALSPADLLASRDAETQRLRALRSGARSSLGFDQELVRSRLGESSAVEFYDVGDDRPQPQPVLSLQARNEAAARKLFDSYVRSMVPSEVATVRRLGRNAEELVVRTTSEQFHVGAIDDSVSIGFHDRAIGAALQSVSAVSRRARQRTEKRAQDVLGKLGLGKRDEVAGVLRLDLSSLAGDPREADRTSPLLRVHFGYLLVEPGVVRLEILTED